MENCSPDCLVGFYVLILDPDTSELQRVPRETDFNVNFKRKAKQTFYFYKMVQAVGSLSAGLVHRGSRFTSNNYILDHYKYIQNII